MNYKTTLLFSLLSILLLGCKKEQGLKGDNGKDGNANIKTYIFEITPVDWAGVKGNYFYFKKMPEITKEIVEYGDVRLYARPNSGSAYEALPISIIDKSIMKYKYSKSRLEIQKTYRDTSLSINNYFEIKVVITKGNEVKLE